MKAKNYVGQTIGQLKVLKELPTHITPNGSHQRIIKVQCTCGNIYTTRLTTAKKNKRCTNCLHKTRRNDLTGKHFGKLIVIAPATDYISPSGYHLSRWKCKCDCGNLTIVVGGELTSGSTRSCGCLKNTAGLLKDNQHLISQYDFDKNKNIDINTLTARSCKKVWWKCSTCGNSWKATIASQNDKINHGCPYCSGRLVTKGKNDLLSQYPTIVAKYWDFKRNKIKPDEISVLSSKKVYWKCEYGHEWKASVANKVGGSGCPKCNIENVNSFCEQAFFYYLKQAFPNAINSDHHIGMELDIYLPSIKTGIEYDGEPWHRTKRKTVIDQRKNNLCKEKGIKLIRIREPNLAKMENCIVFKRTDTESNTSLDNVINEVLRYLGINNIQANTLRDNTKILNQFAQKKLNNSLAVQFTKIAKEWNYERNSGLTPDRISKASRHKVWWKDKYGHEWQATVSDRTRPIYIDPKGKTHHPQGCPYCSNKRVLPGFNDLASQNPEIMKYWNFDKNKTINPNQITSGSKKLVWWIDKYGHEWHRAIEYQVQHNRCPVCYKQRRSPSVLCVETGKQFKTGKEAAIYFNLTSPTSIYRCCRGEQKTAAGYHWQFLSKK